MDYLVSSLRILNLLRMAAFHGRRHPAALLVPDAVGTRSKGPTRNLGDSVRQAPIG